MKLINNFYEEGKNFINICERLQLLVRNIIIFNNTDNYFEKDYESKLLDFSHIKLDYCEKLSEELFNPDEPIEELSNVEPETNIQFNSDWKEIDEMLNEDQITSSN